MLQSCPVLSPLASSLSNRKIWPHSVDGISRRRWRRSQCASHFERSGVLSSHFFLAFFLFLFASCMFFLCGQTNISGDDGRWATPGLTKNDAKDFCSPMVCIFCCCSFTRFTSGYLRRLWERHLSQPHLGLFSFYCVISCVSSRTHAHGQHADVTKSKR